MDAPIDAAGRVIYTPSRLNQEVRLLLETALPALWVEGEISNLARPSSGHLYFTLKDRDAQVRCAFFKGKAVGLHHRPENGDHVRVRAKVSLYPARGEFQLIVEHLEDAGEGALQRALEALKAKLQAEGLFDPARKRPLSRLPRRIGVITSPTGAAIRDVLTVLRRRFPALPVRIYPVPVQGDAAAPAIVEALVAAARRRDVDVLLLTRGGGSLEDLWPFNDERVVRAVHACPIPVVSAVGHEVDVTLSDLAADQRAATPSAAAELLSPDSAEWVERLTAHRRRITDAVRRLIRQRRDGLGALTRRLTAQHPGRRLKERAQRLDELEQRLVRACRDNLAGRRRTLEGLARALHAVSPLATLERGYAVVQRERDGTLLRDAVAVEVGETVRATLARGKIVARVESRHTEETDALQPPVEPNDD